MKIQKRYIALAIFIALAVILKMDVILIGTIVVLGLTFYGFNLLAKQSRLDVKKLKQTKNDPNIQTLLHAQRQTDLVNWQFQLISTTSTTTNQGEIGMLVSFGIGFMTMLHTLLNEKSLILKTISLVASVLIAGGFYRFFNKKRQANQVQNLPNIEKFKLTPNYLLYTKNEITKQIHWHAIEQIDYIARTNIEPSAIQMIVTNQVPIIIEENSLMQDIHITIKVLKNYWYLCAKGKPFPKIS